jgi:S1-C subfamily serine protease
VRPNAIAVVAVVAALLGSGAALLVAKSAGLLTESTTVVVEADAPDPQPTPAAVKVPERPLPGNGFDPASIYQQRIDGVVTIEARFGSGDDQQASQGSGFVVSPMGYVITNSHVVTTAGESADNDDVEGARQVFVQFADRDRAPAEIVGWDLFNDVAVLKVDPKQHALEPLPLGRSSEVVVGEPVAAIGSPFGSENAGTLTVGVVSGRRAIDALTSAYDVIDAIQVDAPINRGNSGGPLFDAHGRVIGINAQIRSRSGNAEGVGFAIPIDTVRRSMAQLVASGAVRYGYVGISTEDLTPGLAKKLGLPVSRGATVVDVRDGPGREAGLRDGEKTVQHAGRSYQTGGDVIVAIGGRPVRAGDDVVRIVTSSFVPGETAVFTLIRDGKRLKVPVRLGSRPLDPND